MPAPISQPRFRGTPIKITLMKPQNTKRSVLTLILCAFIFSLNDSARADLLVHYPFNTQNGTVVENEGTLANGALSLGGTYGAGKDASFGTAFLGNRTGANDSTVLTGFTGNQLGMGSGGVYTAMAWINWAGSFGSTDHMVFGQDDGNSSGNGAQLHHGVRDDSAPNNIHFGGWGGSQDMSDAGAVPVATWTHVTWQYDGTDGVVYVNGIETTRAAKNNITSPTLDVIIGATTRDGSPYQSFNGAIDEVKIFDEALTASQIVTEMSPIAIGPEINSFTVNHPTIPSGLPVTFDWNLSPTATAISIDQGVGNVVPNTSGGVGSITITGPNVTTNYTISASDTNGTTTEVVTVTVTNQPIIETFTVSPSVITPGESVTVSWTTLNASTITLDGSPVAASGSSAFAPASSTSYTLAVTNGNGSDSAVKAVSVVIPGEPIISEFVASNNGSLLDEDGDESDWIQITNYSGSPTVINATNRYYLTDSPTNPTKWEIPAQNIAPSASILVFAAQKDRTTPEMHSNFSLSSNGEYLALVKVVGGITTILSEFNDYPNQFDDISYGVLPSDLSDYRYFAVPSPNADNAGTSYADYVRDTSFSIGRGLYASTQSVAITSNTIGAQIYYTTNGSEPAAGVGTLYTAPISISSTTVLRAVATQADFLPTNIDTNSYIFRSDIVTQSSTPINWPASSPNSQTLDYEMDTPASVGTTTQGMIDALGAIPSISIVTEQDHLTDSSTGIYVHAGNRGSAWERKSSVELIHPPGYVDPDGNIEGFQSEIGLRIRGGFSRSNGNPKHAFRLFFRRSYGDKELNYPLFGSKGTDVFKGIDLRTSQNYSWAFQNNNNNTFMREVFARDTQRDMENPHTRSRYYHLYLNGVYWGLYMTQERAEAEYAESYFGGDDSEYDVAKSAGSSGGYDTEMTDGNNTDWMAAYALTQGITGTTGGVDNYLHIQGLNASGVRNPAVPIHVNMEQLINYMIVVFYNGSYDAPLSTFGSIQASNNWFALRNRVSDDRGWNFYAHDMEHSLGTGGNSTDRTGPFPYDTNEVEGSFASSNPQYFHQYLSSHPEYLLKFADLAHEAFFNGGVYTNASVLARFGEREATVTQVIDAEAARWGDGRDRSTWNSAVASLKNWTNNRHLTVLSQISADGHYPSTDAPVFNQHGGQVTTGFNLAISNPNGSGTTYYTTDGSDPRLYGGTVSGSATSGTGFTMNTSMTVNSRILLGGVWSALNSADFVIGTTPNVGDLVFSEIHYHPSDPTASEITAGLTDDDDFEFIEIANVTSGPLDLTNITISNDITFAFGGGVIAAGERIIVVRNAAGFVARYSGVSHLGPYTGKLDNGGGTVNLLLNGTTLISSVTWSDILPWPTGADGGGYSLVLIDPNEPLNDPASWRVSTLPGGNPTTSDSNPFLGVAGDDDNGNGILNLVEAVLQDGGGNYSKPVIASTSINDGTGAMNYLTLTMRRAVNVDNATIEVQDSQTLQTWSLPGNQLLSSTPQGDGTVIEVYRLTVPIANADSGYFRLKITTN